MKRLTAPLGLLFCLVTSVAFAQSGEETYFRGVTTHILSSAAASNTMVTGITTGVFAARIIATADIHYTVGVSPQTASATSGTGNYLPADREVIVAVRPGEFIAVIQDTAAGVVYITELTR